MFKLYAQAVFERGNAARFGGFRPKNALFCSKKILPRGETVAEMGAKGRRSVVKTALVEAVSGWRSAEKVGYKVGYKVFSVVVYQALIHGQQLISTQPAAALGSSLVVCQARVLRRWLCLKWRRWASGFRQGGERASGRATAAMRGFGRAGGKGARQAFGVLGACRPSVQSGGLRTAAVVGSVGAGRFLRAPSRRARRFGRGGGGSQNTPPLLKQMRLGVGKFSRILGFGSKNPKLDGGEKQLWKKSAKTKRRPLPKTIQNNPAPRGAAENGRLGVGNFSQKSGIGKFRNSEIRNPRVEKTVMENVHKNKRTPPLQKIARF